MISIDSLEVSEDLIIRIYVRLKICALEENIMHQIYVITFKMQIFQKIFDLVDPGIVGCRCFCFSFFLPSICIRAGKGDTVNATSGTKTVKGFQDDAETLFRKPTGDFMIEVLVDLICKYRMEDRSAHR